MDGASGHRGRAACSPRRSRSADELDAGARSTFLAIGCTSAEAWNGSVRLALRSNSAGRPRAKPPGLRFECQDYKTGREAIHGLSVPTGVRRGCRRDAPGPSLALPAPVFVAALMRSAVADGPLLSPRGAGGAGRTHARVFVLATTATIFVIRIRVVRHWRPPSGLDPTISWHTAAASCGNWCAAAGGHAPLAAYGWRWSDPARPHRPAQVLAINAVWGSRAGKKPRIPGSELFFLLPESGAQRAQHQPLF
jgi:hypothetical protein